MDPYAPRGPRDYPPSMGGGYGPPYGGGPPGGPGGYPPGPYGPPGYGGGGYESMESPLDAEIQVVIREIHAEQALFDSAGEYGDQFKNARRLLAAEADKLENSIDPEWLEVDIAKPIKVTKKVLIPNFRHPHFNFVGKILGPRGATLQAMAKQFKCHIYVLGRGSTKDRNKEQELLASGDPQYAHYGGPLHVKVETIAPAHIAYQRIAGVLEILSRTLLPIRENTDPALQATLEGLDGVKGEEEAENGDGENGKVAAAVGGRGGFRGARGGGFRGARGGGPIRGGRGMSPAGYRPY